MLLACPSPRLPRCYKLPVANSSAVPPHMRKEMGGVCRACFASDSSRLQARSMQPLELREGFLHDLNPDSPGFPHTLGDLAEKLKAWRNRLTTELEAAMPHALRLEEECRALQVGSPAAGHRPNSAKAHTLGSGCRALPIHAPTAKAEHWLIYEYSYYD